MDAVIDVVGTDELPAIVDLYNQIFRPARDIDSFRRRYLGRYNILQMLATVKDKPVGFFLGFELKPDTYYAWFYGVLPDFRRHGVATQLMEAAHDWVRQRGYEVIRVELKTDVLNERSRRAILRIGAKEEGIFRHHMIMPNGRVRDTVYFSIIDTEWPEVKTQLAAMLTDR